MGKINFIKLYRARIEEIDVAIKLSVRNKDWKRKQKLENERKEVLETLEKIQK